MDRAGYHKWRSTLYGFHADTAAGLLREAGYDEELIARVSSLLRKQRLKADPPSQARWKTSPACVPEFRVRGVCRSARAGKSHRYSPPHLGEDVADGSCRVLKLNLPSEAAELIKRTGAVTPSRSISADNDGASRAGGDAELSQIAPRGTAFDFRPRAKQRVGQRTHSAPVADKSTAGSAAFSRSLNWIVSRSTGKTNCPSNSGWRCSRSAMPSVVATIVRIAGQTRRERNACRIFQADAP